MKKSVLLFFLAMLCAQLTWAQEQTINGTVKDQDGTIIPFATITIKGTKISVAATDAGVFRIGAKTGDVLVISALNYNPAQVVFTGETNITVTMQKTTGNLTDVVVTTALGIRRSAKDLGYATTSLSNKTLTQAKSVNVQQALNGKVSGVNISTVNSGVFESAKINIRGIRSLTGNNQPMLVVDGAPTPLGFLSSIPPDDVQDITILKSAASAAIYGPDAVNGVILITTKRGGKNPTITLSSTVQASSVSFFPKIQKEFGAGAGEITDAYGNYLYVPYENQQYGSRFDGSLQPVGVPIEDGSVQLLPYNNSRYQDKIKFWNTGVTFQNSVSIAGEDFYVSVEDANIRGLVPDDKNHRTSFRFNGSKKYNKFSASYGLNYVLSNFDVVNENAFQTTFPDAYNGGLFFLVMQTSSNVPLLEYNDPNNKFADFSNYYNEFAINPYWLIDNIRQSGRQDDLNANLDLNYEILPWLKASTRLSTNVSFQGFKSTNAPVEVSDWAQTSGFYGRPRNSTQYSDRPGYVADGQTTVTRYNVDYFLSGDKDINEDFAIKYIAGGMIRKNTVKDVFIGGNNLLVPNLYNVSVKSGDANVITAPFNNFIQESALLSAYGSLGFSYRGWANVEVTGRNDWDSRLEKENRSFFYPAVNASLVLSDAIEAIQTSNKISYLKLRAALSKSGNVNLAPYATQATYSQPNGFPYGNVGGFTANNTIPADNLKPEFVSTLEFGAELGLFKNRINLEATYFNQKNTNQVLLITRSITTGFTSELANAADFRNYGVEMDLAITPLIRMRKGSINFKINATYNNNEVLSTLGDVPVVLAGTNGFIQLSASSPTVNNIAVVGGPAFQFQLTDYNRDPETGKVIVDPVSGYPSIAPSLVTTGRTLPLWVIGVTPSYTIGNFSVTMTWDYKGGHNFYSGLGSDMDFAGISERSASYGRERFVFPNSVYLEDGKYVPNTSVQVQDGNYGFWTGGSTNTSIATNYFASAAAWRLRELNISYTLPNSVFGKQGFFKKATISFVGKNLFLFVPKSNQWGDPEFNYNTVGNTFGVASSFQSPASRLYGGSLTLQF